MIVLHRHAAGGKTNIGPMDFDKERGSPPGKPAKEIHHPGMAVCSLPARSAAFIIPEQIFRFRRDRHCFVRIFGGRPLGDPARASGRLMTAVPNLNSGLGNKKPNRERGEQRPCALRQRLPGSAAAPPPARRATARKSAGMRARCRCWTRRQAQLSVGA